MGVLRQLLVDLVVERGAQRGVAKSATTNAAMAISPTATSSRSRSDT